MARAGYRIFDADTHIIEAAEPIEAYLSAADKARLAALGPLVGRAPGKGGVSRYRVGKRPELNRLLGSRERVPPSDAVTRGLKDGGTPWDVRWQGPPFPDDRESRSEEHTSELQSPCNLVCRLLLEKKKKNMKA